MQADRGRHEQAAKTSHKLPILIALAVIVGIGAWLLLQKEDEPAPELPAPPAEPAPPPPAATAVDEAPDIPSLPEASPDQEPQETEAATPLPPLSASDDFARDVLSSLNDSDTYALSLQTDNLIQKGAALVDGLSRGNLLRKIIPVNPPIDDFAVVEEQNRLYIDTANYGRYDNLVDLVTGISPEASSEAFHTLRPLLEAAFSQLGYDGDKFDNSLIAAIDQVLAAPEIDEPIALKRDSVAYTYADPELEALPPVHKQLIRMGPENTRKIKAHLSRIRSYLLAQESIDN